MCPKDPDSNLNNNTDNNRASTSETPADENTNDQPRKRRHYLPAEERRKKLLAAARQVFAQTGLEGARTRELAQAAGVNQATLFEHFKSKEALYNEAIVEPVKASLSMAFEQAETFASVDNRATILDRFGKGLLVHLNNMETLYPLLTQVLFTNKEIGKQIYCEHILPLLKMRAANTKKLVKSDIDSEVMQIICFCAVIGLTMHRNFTDGEGDLSHFAEQLNQLLLYGSTEQE